MKHLYVRVCVCVRFAVESVLYAKLEFIYVDIEPFLPFAQ